MEGLEFEEIPKHEVPLPPQSEGDTEALWIHLIIVALKGYAKQMKFQVVIGNQNAIPSDLVSSNNIGNNM